MKSLGNFLLLLPVLLFLIIILINKDLLLINENINLLWLAELTIPLVGFITIFFVIYIILLWIFLKTWNIFTVFKNNRLSSEVNKLKSKLYEERPKLVAELKEEFEKNLEKYKEVHDKEINTYKKENEKILSNLEYYVKTIKEKIDKVK